MTAGDDTALAFPDGPDGERLRAIHAYWDAKRGSRAMPSRADIDPVELKPDLPLLDHDRRAIAERRPLVASGSYTPSPERPWARFSRLVLPLSADGVVVNMLLVALVPVI